MPFKLRPATDEDAQAIAEVYFASFRLLTFLPMLHTLSSYRWYVANRMLKEWAVTVAEDDTGIIAFLGLRSEELGHFYVRPDRIGQGAGTLLLEAAKSSGVEALELWCFQANARARRFYEARGFKPIRFTDGAAARPTGGFDALPGTQHAICPCSRRAKGRSFTRNEPESGECRLTPNGQNAAPLRLNGGSDSQRGLRSLTEGRKR